MKIMRKVNISFKFLRSYGLINNNTPPFVFQDKKTANFMLTKINSCANIKLRHK